MQAFARVDALAVPMREADIDTDQIVPARFMHKPREDYGRYCFHDQRRDPASGLVRPNHVLNLPAYRHAAIIVAGPNFGCGSSREQAVHTLQDFGIRALLGTSFGDIFFNNCLQNGVLPVRLPFEFVERLFALLEAAPGTHVIVDLATQQVTAPDGMAQTFDIDEFRKSALLRGVDEIDATLGLAEHIERYEAGRGMT